ncbi:RloB domain-containing protein [bacterium]|nr:RloB domain-containing protein [Bacteroidales bacterium]MCK5684047.1 RloB domain-containing protein [bacterium]
MSRIMSVYGKRSEESKSLTPNKRIVIACEGTKTEIIYFDYIQKNKKSLNISDLISIEIVNKIDTNSAPKWVGSLLNDFKKEYGFDKKTDKFWAIIDRDPGNNSAKQINEFIADMYSDGYYIGLSNPTFELWLLMHLTNLDDYNYDDLYNNIYNNKRSSGRKRYLEDELSKICGYKKNDYNPAIFITYKNLKNSLNENIKIERDICNLVDNLGTNLCDLLESFEIPDI